MKRAYPVLVGLCLILLFSCAKRAFPPGGPEDKIPPKVTKLSPASGSVKVPLDSSIAIEFSERMSKRSVETGVVISPSVRWRKRYWERTVYVMVPEDGLQPNTTYLVSVWGKAKDAHGVKMGSTFVGGFATGDSLDAGVISGKIVWRKLTVEAAVVELYDIADVVKSLEAAEPVHVAFSGHGGLYEIPFVNTRSKYRIVAFTDINLNYSYDKSEKIGCYPDTLSFETVSRLDSIDISLCAEGLGGTVEGRIDSSYDFVAIAGEDSTRSYIGFPGRDGSFEIECVKPGHYVGRIFVDRNNNRRFDAADSVVFVFHDSLDVCACMKTRIEWEPE